VELYVAERLTSAFKAQLVFGRTVSVVKRSSGSATLGNDAQILDRDRPAESPGSGIQLGTSKSQE